MGYKSYILLERGSINIILAKLTHVVRLVLEDLSVYEGEFDLTEIMHNKILIRSN